MTDPEVEHFNNAIDYQRECFRSQTWRDLSMAPNRITALVGMGRLIERRANARLDELQTSHIARVVIAKRKLNG